MRSEIIPTVAVEAVRRLRALRLGRYASSVAARRTRCSVSLEIRISRVRPLRMYDAVVAETPARAATSLRVGLLDLVANAPPDAFGISSWIEPICVDE